MWGTMKNTGFEFDLNFNVVDNGRFSYDFGVIGTVMSNKFVNLSNSRYVGQDYYLECGTSGSLPLLLPAAYRKGAACRQFLHVALRRKITSGGEWLVYDKDGDIIRASQATEEDRCIVGNGMPKFTLSTTHNFRHRNFDLSLFFRGAFDYDIFNIHDFYYGTRNFTGNVLKKAYGGRISDVSPNAAPS